MNGNVCVPENDCGSSLGVCRVWAADQCSRWRFLWQFSVASEQSP